MLLDKITELEHDLLLAENALFLPFWKGVLCSLEGSVHLLGSGTGYSADQFISGWVIVVDPLVSLGFHKLAIDEQLD